jgi:hypothetical protein
MRRIIVPVLALCNALALATLAMWLFRVSQTQERMLYLPTVETAQSRAWRRQHDRNRRSNGERA